MVTFTLEHAVDFSTGVARVGKCHVIDKRERYENEMRSEKIKKANKARSK